MIIKPILNILGQDINVKFKRNLKIEEINPITNIKEVDECIGAFIPGTNTIYIDESLKDKPTKRDDTFFHELIECILALLEVDIEEHSKITQLATPLFGFLRQYKLIKPFDFKLIETEEDNGPV